MQRNAGHHGSGGFSRSSAWGFSDGLTPRGFNRRPQNEGTGSLSFKVLCFHETLTAKC